MGRSKRDELKRKIAQASNHIAHSILDINDVYVMFDDAAQKLEESGYHPVNEAEEGSQSHHAKYAEYLKTLMLSLSMDRDALLKFALDAWGLDEDQLRVFM